MDTDVMNFSTKNEKSDEREVLTYEIESTCSDTPLINDFTDDNSEEREIDVTKAGPSNSQFVPTDRYGLPGNIVKFKLGDSSDSSWPRYSYGSIRNATLDAKQAGSDARQAATSCFETIAKTQESVKFAKRRALSAKKKANRLVGLPNAAHYNFISEHFMQAIHIITRNVSIVREAAEWAKLSANTVDDFEKKILSLLERGSLLDYNYLMTEACDCLNNANLRTVEAKTAEYIFLNDMKYCWKSPSGLMGDSDAADSNTSSMNDPSARSSDRCFLMVTIVFILLGYTMLILLLTLNLRKYDFLAVLTVGSMSGIWIVGYSIYKLLNYLGNRKRMADIRKRNEMMRFIDGRRRALNEYFVKHRIAEPVKITEDS